MAYRLKDIAAALGAEAFGAADLLVTGVAEPAQAGPDDLALALEPRFAEGLSQGSARAAMLWQGADWQGYGLDAAILVPRPRHAMAALSVMMDPGTGQNAGLHPSAVIDPSAVLGEGVSVGALSVIGPQVQIGDGSVIGAQVSIAAGVVLGTNADLRDGVRIGPRVRIGKNFIAQSGAVIGGDGFSFVTPEPSSAEVARRSLGADSSAQGQTWARIHSLGAVILGDDIEIGANSTIDAGTVRATQVGSGTKIDNLVQIGHNVRIGRHCLLCAQVGVAGSTVIGDHVVLGGQTGVSDNIFIGDHVVTGGASVVLSNVPAGRVVLGYPAAKMDTTLEIFRSLRRLPRLTRDIAALKKAVFKSGGND